MKFLVSIAVLLFAINFAYADDVATKKTCKDFLPEATCDSLRKLADRLQEASTTVQDAIDAAVKAHIQNTKDVLQFVKNYIASHIQCEKVLTEDMCTALHKTAAVLKLTKMQVQLAIEMAVNGTKATVKDVYQRTVSFLTEDITCERIFGDDACANMFRALDKFHEQRALLKTAIMSVALKHYQNTKDLLKMVQYELVAKIKNFTCTTVLPATVCTKLADIAGRLKILPGKVREAIELAVLNGVTTAKGVYDFTIDFLTNQINCENILTPMACQNLVAAAKKLHEQTQLIKQAIMAATLQKITDVTTKYKYVRDMVIEKAMNFTCTDVLPQLQCDFLTKLATRFHIRTSELRRVIIESIINGTRTAKQLYDATINALLEEAKDLKCEDMISASVCQALDAFAANLKESVADVNDAVRRALAQGKSTYADIKQFVKELLVNEKSCRDLFHSYLICKSLRVAAWVKGMTFDVVIGKLRELYANGVTTLQALKDRIRSFINHFNPLSDSMEKRSLDSANFAMKKIELVDLVMQIVGGIAKFSQKTTENIKAEITRLVEAGKLRYWNIIQKVKEVLSKYNPLGDPTEMADEIPSDFEDIFGHVKKASKMIEESIRKMVASMAASLNLTKDQIANLFKDLYESAIKDLHAGIVSSL